MPKSIPEDKLITLFTLNCRSVKNKTLAIVDFIQSHNADLLAITETWLGSEIDKSVISDITPQGYGIHHVSRHGKKGGGVALVYNSNLEVKSIRNEDKWSNFELLECSVTHRNVEFTIVVLYRPSPSKNNNFFEEFSSFVPKAADSPHELIITGDFNFHLDDPNDSNSRTFLEILDEHSLSQHVVGATHVRGHTLDVVIARESSQLLHDRPFIFDPILCNDKGDLVRDHMAIRSNVRILKLPRQRKTVTCRKYHDIQICEFSNDLENLSVLQNPVGTTDDLVRNIQF